MNNALHNLSLPENHKVQILMPVSLEYTDVMKNCSDL